MFKVNNNLYLTLKFIKVGLYSEGLTFGMLIVIFARGGGGGTYILDSGGELIYEVRINRILRYIMLDFGKK